MPSVLVHTKVHEVHKFMHVDFILSTTVKMLHKTELFLFCLLIFAFSILSVYGLLLSEKNRK